MNMAGHTNIYVSSCISQGRLTALAHNPQIPVTWHNCFFLTNLESKYVFPASKQPSVVLSRCSPVVLPVLSMAGILSTPSPHISLYTSLTSSCHNHPGSLSRGFLWPPEPTLPTCVEVSPKLIHIPQTMTCED